MPSRSVLGRILALVAVMLLAGISLCILDDGTGVDLCSVVVLLPVAGLTLGALPPLVGPVVVQGVRTGRPGSPPAVVIDGSELVAPRTPAACPGATHAYDFARGAWIATRIIGAGPNVRGYYGAGLAVHDSHDVEITGLEIRNFCAGVVGVRSNNVNVHGVRLVDHHGAAGLIFTGDDGNAGITGLSFNNRLADSVLLDNGDGFEFTRGTRDSVAEGNYIALTQPLPEEEMRLRLTAVRGTRCMRTPFADASLRLSRLDGRADC